MVDGMRPHVVAPEQRPLVMSCPYVKAMLKMGADFMLHIQARFGGCGAVGGVPQM